VGVVLYQILSDGVLLRTSPVMTSATIAELKTGQTYHFSLRAVDAAGNVSQESNVVTVTIPTS
jgi:hypothetical protein